jgi:hypothetical protein
VNLSGKPEVADHVAQLMKRIDEPRKETGDR